MVGHLNGYLKVKNSEITENDVKLLQVAYRNIISKRRRAWRITKKLEKKNEKDATKYSAYRMDLEMEIADRCEMCLNLINDFLLKKAGNNAEIEVQLHKTKGDYYRYICEFSNGSQLRTAIQSAESSYAEAERVAEKLEITHPSRLGVILNHTVFLYEVKKDTKMAQKKATETFEESIQRVDDVKDEHYKDATLILKLMRDNMNIWTEELEMNG